MKDKVSIEELVKERFETATAPVPAAAWEAIKVKAGIGNAMAASASAASGGFSSGLIVGLVASTLAIGGVSVIHQQTMADRALEAPTTIAESTIDDDQQLASDTENTNESIEIASEDIQSSAGAIDQTDTEIIDQAVSAQELESFEEALEQVAPKVSPQEDVTIEEVAEASLTSSIQADKVGGSVPLEVSFSAPDHVTRAMWDAGDGSPKQDMLSLSHTYDKPGTYTVTLIAQREDGFVYQDQMLVQVVDDSEEAEAVPQMDELDIPNVFTPNSDGINDTYLIEADGVAEMQLSVYNSVGRLVFEKRSKRIEWNGREPNGTDCPTGTYFFHLKAIAEDGSVEIRKGSLTLTR